MSAAIVETRWWWVRHAPVNNPRHVIYGASEMPANISDTALFGRAAARLPEDAFWMVTTLSRTVDTAAALRSARPSLDKAEPVVEPRFIEQDFGAWQGARLDQVAGDIEGKRHPFWLAPAAYRPPEGETFIELVERTREGIAHWNREAAGRDLVVVAHGGSIRAAISVALDLPPEIALRCQVDNVALTRLDHLAPADGDPMWRVGCLNVLA